MTTFLFIYILSLLICVTISLFLSNSTDELLTSLVASAIPAINTIVASLFTATTLTVILYQLLYLTPKFIINKLKHKHKH